MVSKGASVQGLGIWGGGSICMTACSEEHQCAKAQACEIIHHGRFEWSEEGSCLICPEKARNKLRNVDPNPSF